MDEKNQIPPNDQQTSESVPNESGPDQTNETTLASEENPQTDPPQTDLTAQPTKETAKPADPAMEPLPAPDAQVATGYSQPKEGDYVKWSPSATLLGDLNLQQGETLEAKVLKINEGSTQITVQITPRPGQTEITSGFYSGTGIPGTWHH